MIWRMGVIMVITDAMYTGAGAGQAHGDLLRDVLRLHQHRQHDLHHRHALPQVSPSHRTLTISRCQVLLCVLHLIYYR